MSNPEHGKEHRKDAKQRSVLVTGASRGIGAAVAKEFSSRGWTVLSPSRRECDLRSADSVAAWLRAANLKVDTLVNNAGENNIQPVERMKVEDWNGTLAVNLTAPMLLSQAAAVHMRAQRWGRIVNVSSIFGLLSRAGRGSYAASKAGLLGLTRTTALEWGAENVLVNAVCPGYVETDLTRANNSPDQIRQLAAGLPLGRLGSPAEVAKAIYFLGSEENTFLTGQAIVVDGGFSIQ
jgi:3-oxoacyl-[acyl-carrier protein] reductase